MMPAAGHLLTCDSMITLIAEQDCSLFGTFWPFYCNPSGAGALLWRGMLGNQNGAGALL